MKRKRLIDELVVAYVDWREKCARVEDSYRLWALERGPRGALAFEFYVAALDAEEEAAENYARLVWRAGRLPRSEPPRLEPLGGPAWGTGWP